MFAQSTHAHQATLLLRLDFVCVLVGLGQVALLRDLGLLLLVGLGQALPLGGSLQVQSLAPLLEVLLDEVHELVSLEGVGQEEHHEGGRRVDAVEETEHGQHHDRETGHHEDGIVEELHCGGDRVGDEYVCRCN